MSQLRSKLSQQIKEVNTFSELVTTPLLSPINAIFWERKLEGDFEELTQALYLDGDLMEIRRAQLLALNLSPGGQQARSELLHDWDLLSEYGADPSINLIRCYPRDAELDWISTDVYSFHVDRSPVATDTFLCTYSGASSFILPNAQAIRKMDIPEIRIKIKSYFKVADQDYEQFCTDNYFDLHYQPMPHAQPIDLKNGKLWRLAVDHPYLQTEPCIHRAPEELNGELRLLLIC